jgi:ZIP family zinc transporter
VCSPFLKILNLLVAKLLGGHSHRQAEKGNDQEKKKSTRKSVKRASSDAFNPPCCSKDPINQLEKFKKMASVLEHEQEGKGEGDDDNVDPEMDMDMDIDIEDDFVDNLPLDDNSRHSNSREEEDNEGEEGEEKEKDDENKRLVKMGMNTALAIGLHNFPEGLATFVAALDDPRVGSILAFAIAIHNIPEGLCVALPIFYATGNRRNAFLWALLSGASEFVAALLGWAILANSFTDDAFAVLFGLVAGMMVIISVRELLPTAHFYDPEDTVVTYSYIGGMGLMAISLVLFQL